MSLAPTVPGSLTADHLARTHIELTARIEALQEELDEVTVKLIDAIGVGSAVETTHARFCVVQNTQTRVDFDAIVAEHPAWARKVTKKVFDVAKFNLLRKADAVPKDVLSHVQDVPGKPFLRITKR